MEEKREIGVREKYFAASNSAKGFYNRFDEIFVPRALGKLFILKGGPGTGKSRFMKDCAAAAEAAGHTVEYFYCSSDPGSLDGILIGKDICAVIDGTPPHAADPLYPGCVDSIINLGDFWDEARLEERRDEIITLCDDKKRAYRDAYRFLEAAALVENEVRREIYESVDMKKLRGAVDRLFLKVRNGEGFRKSVRLVNSIGMQGAVGFDTFREKAKRNIYILDAAESSAFILSEIYKKAAEKHLDVSVSYSPVSVDVIDALYFPSISTSFTVIKNKKEVGDEDKIINMMRFVDRERLSAIRGRVKFSLKCRDALYSEAVLRLERAKKAHFALEEIYIGAMDFNKKEEASKDWINKIIGYCEKAKNMVK